MNILHVAILAVHLLTAVIIIALILVQPSEVGGITAVGSGASGTIFGSRGNAPFLFKLTFFFAGLFFITSLSLGTMGNKEAKAQAVVTPQPTTAPALPPVK